MKKIANPGKQDNKKKSYNNEIHNKPTPAGPRNVPLHGYKSRVCSLASSVVK
jgi:hypothetical protein